jgi:hypothetical protein
MEAETLDSTFSLSVVSCSCSPVGMERLKGCNEKDLKFSQRNNG